MQCPFCQGEISDSAIRCRHCAKSLYPSSYGQASPSPSGAGATPPPAAGGFRGGPPPSGATPPPDPPQRVGFVGGPPKDWKAPDAKEDEAPRGFTSDPSRAGAATPSSTEGLENTLWAFAQEMPGRHDRRVSGETERQQQARLASIMDDVRQRAEEVARAAEEMHPEQVLAKAHEAREHIATLPNSNDDDVQAELGKIVRIIDRLEGAGYRSAGPVEGMVAVKQMSTAAKRGLAVAAVLTALLIWGVVAFLRASDAENAKIPGRLMGVVSLERGGNTIIRVPFENVRVVSQTDAAQALLNKVKGYQDRSQAFKELSSERGALPAVAEARLSPIGEFVIDNVPPGKYYVIVVTASPKMADTAGAWMVPVEVQATKVTELALSEGNRL